MSHLFELFSSLQEQSSSKHISAICIFSNDRECQQSGRMYLACTHLVCQVLSTDKILQETKGRDHDWNEPNEESLSFALFWCDGRPWKARKQATTNQSERTRTTALCNLEALLHEPQIARLRRHQDSADVGRGESCEVGIRQRSATACSDWGCWY